MVSTSRSPGTPVPLATPEPAPAQWLVASAGVLAGAVLGTVILVRSGELPALLYLVGLAFGLVLFNSRFGFSSAWRQLVAVGQGRALRAQMLMLALACTLFAPMLAHQLSFRDVPVSPSLAPISTALFVGAFLFGVGMQLGGSCASGTLFAVGSGQTAVVITLTGFVGGSTLGALSQTFWNALPAHDPVSLTRWGGYAGAWAISLTVMGLVVVLTLVVERHRLPPPVEPTPVARGPARLVRGSWPLWVGAVLLAGLNALTLYLSGSAWGITYAFTLWGTKLLGLLGVHPDHLASYRAGVLADKTSVMDLGIVIGALVASSLAGSWVLHRDLPLGLAVGSAIGGVLMGYGAQLAYGCNIGAFFSGVASFSLHGWLWAVTALAGTLGGLRLRPLFGLTNPRPTDSIC